MSDSTAQFTVLNNRNLSSNCMKFLNGTELYNSSQVCKFWSTAITDTVIWSSRSINVCRIADSHTDHHSRYTDSFKRSIVSGNLPILPPQFSLPSTIHCLKFDFRTEQNNYRIMFKKSFSYWSSSVKQIIYAQQSDEKQEINSTRFTHFIDELSRAALLQSISLTTGKLNQQADRMISQCATIFESTTKPYFNQTTIDLPNCSSITMLSFNPTTHFIIN